MGVAHAERDLNLHEVVLRNWVSELAADPARAFPGLEISPRHWKYNRAGCAARSLILSGARPPNTRRASRGSPLSCAPIPNGMSVNL
jgi:hypothetical protein